MIDDYGSKKERKNKKERKGNSNDDDYISQLLRLFDFLSLSFDSNNDYNIAHLIQLFNFLSLSFDSNSNNNISHLLRLFHSLSPSVDLSRVPHPPFRVSTDAAEDRQRTRQVPPGSDPRTAPLLDVDGPPEAQSQLRLLLPTLSSCASCFVRNGRGATRVHFCLSNWREMILLFFMCSKRCVVFFTFIFFGDWMFLYVLSDV